jgi:hypothetical protein
LKLTLSFLSPITPTSTLRQSIPAGYFIVYAEGDFDVNIYVDLNGQWVSGDRASEVSWSFRENSIEQQGLIKTWKITKRVEALFTEFWDRAEWGSLHFTGPSVSISYDQYASSRAYLVV